MDDNFRVITHPSTDEMKLILEELELIQQAYSLPSSNGSLAQLKEHHKKTLEKFNQEFGIKAPNVVQIHGISDLINPIRDALRKALKEQMTSTKK